MDVTVVVACRNMEATLGETLEGIAGQDWDRPWELIFADNGSTDGSARIFNDFAAAHPELDARLVDASAQRGKSFALNQAVLAARGRAILLNDADDVMAPGYLAILGAALDNGPLVGGGNDFLKLNQGWVRTYRNFGSEVREMPVAKFPPYLPFVGGNSMGFTGELFRAIGGFRTDFEPFEDLDFCFRAQQAGYAVGFLPEATMHYRRRADPVGIRRQAYAYARAWVKVGKAYRTSVPKARRGWRNYVKGWQPVAKGALRYVLSPRGRDASARARLAHDLGWQMGKTAGILKFRAPPR